ncbi:hypothetical protein CC2G_003589 [Coprinopsis cinerea AmutBmut pab1-1]|nr:hypothetical protein CC2G_003589 [Coprinopsis cinerea AmutBmut pab1-1]
MVRLEYDLPHGLQKLYLYARYCIHLFHRKLNPTHIVPPFDDIALDIKAELRQLVTTIYEASKNLWHLCWSVDEVISHLKLKSDLDSLLKEFGPSEPTNPHEPSHLAIELEPCCFVDTTGKLVAWHLPSSVSQQRIASVLLLSHTFRASYPLPPFRLPSLPPFSEPWSRPPCHAIPLAAVAIPSRILARDSIYRMV